MTRYEDIPGINWSRLKGYRTSPKHARYGGTDTDAMLRGRMAHCALYEPELYQGRYVVFPGKKKQGKRWEAFKEFNAGLEIVTKAQYDLGLAIAQAVREDPVAGPLLEGTYTEQVLTWNDPATGRKCKGRVDQVNGRLGDLKTTVSVDPRRFGAQVESLGYHGQIAFYSDGLFENGIAVQANPALIAVEAKPPHDVVVYEVSDDDILAGRDLYRSLMEMYIECEAKGEWPGIAGGKMLTLQRPAWAVAQEESEITWGGESVEF